MANSDIQPRVRNEPRKTKKEIGKIQKVLYFIIFPILFVGIVATGIANRIAPVTIHSDRITIHLHEMYHSAAVSLLTGGYEVRFDDIASIELMHVNAWQLGQSIDGLHIPTFLRGRRVGAAQYSGSYRIHVSLDPHAPRRLIWITRRANVPVLISYHIGNKTEEMYEHLIIAWQGHHWVPPP